LSVSRLRPHHRVLIVDKAVTHGEVKRTKNAKNRTVEWLQ
jgi:hypothetical protein